jgi:hypothetical protein
MWMHNWSCSNISVSRRVSLKGCQNCPISSRRRTSPARENSPRDSDLKSTCKRGWRPNSWESPPGNNRREVPVLTSYFYPLVMTSYFKKDIFETRMCPIKTSISIIFEGVPMSIVRFFCQINGEGWFYPGSWLIVGHLWKAPAQYLDLRGQMTFNEYEGQDSWAQNRCFFLDSDSKVMAKLHKNDSCVLLFKSEWNDTKFLVGVLEHYLWLSIYWNVIIPTDFHVFQRGRAQPPTSY